MNKEQYLAKRKEMLGRAEALLDEGKMDEFNAIHEEIVALDGEYEAAAKARANLEALQNDGRITNLANHAESAEGLTPIATFNATPQAEPQKPQDPTNSTEYQTAFMNFAARGTPIPDNLRAVAYPQKFQNDVTTTGDTGAVIPTTIVQEIIRELESYGNIFSKVRRMNIQGGVDVPVADLKPVATWIGETTPSADQKLAVNDKVSFSYYGLECKIAQTLLASVTTLEIFQREFASLAVEAIIKALEIATIKGDGSGKMLGVAVDPRVPAENVLELTEADISSWATWKKKVFAKMKRSYRKGEFVLAQGTFDTYIDGLVDTTGQPIGRVNYGTDNGETYRFGGKNVETVEEDILPTFDAATSGEIFGVFVDWKNYAINSNMEMTVVKWQDHDNNQLKNKAILICDGKLLDPHGVLILKKA